MRLCRPPATAVVMRLLRSSWARADGGMFLLKFLFRNDVFGVLRRDGGKRSIDAGVAVSKSSGAGRAPPRILRMRYL
eukprot:11182553-Lingulodinium_polyedra.AAC.1